jgi:O-antigen ligase
MSVDFQAAWSAGNRLAPRRPLTGAALTAAGAAMLLGLAAVLAEALYRNPPSLTIALGGGVLLTIGGLLAIVRYDLAVAIGFLLLAIVIVEPAPSDGLFVLVMAVAVVTGRFGLKRVPRAARYIVTFFLLMSLLSLVDVVSWSLAARFLATSVYLAVFSFWLAAYVDRPSRARRLVRAYLFAAVASAVAASAALFVHYPQAKLLIGDGQRAKGLFKDPNVFGPFLIPIALILIEEMFNPRLLRLRRPLVFASFLALTLGVVFSYSRAAWVNYAISLIVLIAIVVLRRPDRRAISLLLVILFSGLATAGTIIGSGSLSFLHERAKLQNYDTSRFAAQSHGLSAGFEHPFGVGPGQFDVISRVSSHSLYVRSLSEQGVLGLVAVIALVVATLAFGAVNVLRGRDTFGISAAALFAAWIGLVINSFFVDTLHWRHLWLLAALIWAGAMRKGNVRSVIARRLPAVRARAPG